MSTTALQRRRILFLDDDAAFLEMIERVMGALSNASWEIFTAQNTGKALATLQDNTMNMVVVDVQMPVVDGLQFLTLLNRRHPNLLKAVLTGFANDNYRAACLSSGAEMFLEKPKTTEGFESLFATLNELVKWQPEEGFRGVLRRVGLPDVLQMECLSRNSSILEVTARKATGRIFIKDGAIIHAVFGSRTGEEAFNYLLALKGGEFKLRSFAEPPEKTIEGSWEFLLMEAARLRDEIESTAGQELVSDTTTVIETEIPTVEAAASEPASAEPLVAEEQLNVSIESIFQRVSTDAREIETAPIETEMAPVTAEPAVAVQEDTPEDFVDVEMPRRKIDEVLVCSSHGDVLYEWQCRNSDVWVNFLEFVSQKSRQASQGLVLGRFDRLEIQSGDARMIAHISANGGTLVRSSAAVSDSIETKPE
ncbi:MAG TPA: response regulator [Candidatus Nitrosotalea sp.]|nr:response regulator [Candidatus Nitrosotalea sp.]